VPSKISHPLWEVRITRSWMVISRFSDSYNCLLCSPGHSLRIMEDECVNMSVSPNGLNLANSPVALNASSSSCSEFGGLGCLGLSALAAPSQLGTFPDWWRTSETQTRAAAAFFPPLLGLHPFVLSTFKSHDPVDFQSRPSGKRSLSLGVNGTVNGRSASSPAGNAPAMNTSSLLAKGKKETPQANSHEPGQLHQKAVEKKPNKRPLETSSMSGSQSESQSESSSEVEESSSDPDDMEEEDDDDQSSDSEESGYEKQSPAKQKVKVSASLELLCKQRVYRISELFSLHISSSNMFLNLYPNGAINGAVQDAPLALITKPRIQSSTPNSKPLLAATSPPCSMPINLSTGTKEMLDSSASPLKTSASSEPRSRKTTQTVHSGRSLTRTNTSCLPVDLVRGSEPDIHSSKNSDDSLGDDYDEDEDEDSGSSFSESESILGSDSDAFEDDVKESVETEADSDAERSPLKLAQTSLSTQKSSSSLSATPSLLNIQITKPPSLHSSFFMTIYLHSGEQQGHRLHCEWQRETRIRTVAGRLQGEVAYFAPCGKKLRQYPDVVKYLIRNGITEISRDNFSFSTKIKVGDFYEAREGPEGLQWFLLAEDEIAPSIIAMDGRRSRRTKSEHQPTGDSTGAIQWKPYPLNGGENNFQDVSDAKLLRKLEAQEIARQAAQIKMMRKLEKQAIAQAAKEAKKQQAIMAAEERRKKREQLKILKQQEKIKRIQQIRMEKELRAQQILEVCPESYCRNILKHFLSAVDRIYRKKKKSNQRLFLNYVELERHRLDMERERRRQHMILMKAVEARKKAEVRRMSETRKLNKERKLELRRLELEKAKELKKPNEDMCLADHKPLPELSRIPGLVLAGSTFSNCLMVLQFLHSFGKVLGLDLNSDPLTIGDLQEGLLNIAENMEKVQDLLVTMLSAAVCDPGVPAGHKSKTILGDHLTNVEINRDNVSEILQIYMEGHSEQKEVAMLAFSLRTKPFQAHSPSQKASVLAFLVNELCCSKVVISEIDKNIDYMTNLRKDKWVVEGKLRKLRSIHTKKTGKKDNSWAGENNHAFVLVSVQNKSKRKEGDSEEEEDEDDDSEDQRDDEEEEEEEAGGKRGKKTDICEEEDDSVRSASIEELEKQIEKTYKQQSQIRQKLFDSSHLLRSVMIGQDRYKRRYWVLPQCSGIFVEGTESSEGAKQNQCLLWSLFSVSTQSTDNDTASQQDKDNLFLQKPGSLSKLSKLLEVGKMGQDSDINTQNSHSFKVPTTASYPSYPASQIVPTQQGLMDKLDTAVPFLLSATQLKSIHWVTQSPQSSLHYDQLSKTLTEKSSQWFSLFPRSPCDESSVTSGSSPPVSSSSPQPIRTKSPSFLSTNPSQVKSGIHEGRLTQHDMSSSVASPSLPFSGTPLPPMVDLASQHAEGHGNEASFLENNSINKCETSESPSDKSTCASYAAIEGAKTQDYPYPRPIPEEMLHGWWSVSDMENLHSLVKTLHCRGIREKALQKQIQKNMEHMTKLCENSKDAIGVTGMEKQEVSKEAVESWCVEEKAMEVDIRLLRQVEALERKVISASLQVKGWMHPEPQSDSKDLVYHEHKPFSSLAQEKKRERDASQEDVPGSMVRRPNNPLDIAVTRLAELERNIERSSEEEVAPGTRLWRKSLGQVRSSAQLSLCIQQLQKSIAWERAIMKVHCQFCQKGDNEELLLLCDGCDRGCHTYCHKPKINTVPDGDWFCPACESKQSRTAGGGKESVEGKRSIKPSVDGELISEEDARSNNVPKKGTKEVKKRKADNSPPSSQTVVVKSHIFAMQKAQLCLLFVPCRVLLAELEAHQDAWPFLTPVNHRAVPGYRKVIKKPMDFSTIKEKLTSNQYLNLETFIIDVNLVFDNCERFNEDDSEIGRAGHRMRRFFDKRWTEFLQ
uniref:Bromodomain adjacent to zinc finger domain 2B n=1 Tax=Astatotilapia calliptera TaxID=8154 RepID=A0A3P8PR94_ASTCA